MKDLTEKKKQLQYLPYAGLTLLTLLIMIGPLERGELLGSEGDWLSQHVGAAETLRQTMLERGTIFPQHISIGGGSNSYDLAYYGMFRPDVLISCLIPDVEMKYIVSVYSVICALTAVNLCPVGKQKGSLGLLRLFRRRCHGVGLLLFSVSSPDNVRRLYAFSRSSVHGHRQLF